MDNGLGLLIKRAREEQGLTQEQLAERLNTNRGYIGQLETGSIKLPGPKRMALLERYLGVSRDQMLRAAGRLGPADSIDLAAELRRIRAIEDPETRAQALEDLPDDIQESIRLLSLDYVRQAILTKKG